MRVVLVVPTFPKLSETFIVRKFMGLLDHGVDVHVVCNQTEKQDWQHFPELLSSPGARRRVHLSVPARPKWKLILEGPASVTAALVKRPGTVLRYSLGSARDLVIDSPIISLAPDVVHFEFGALAVGRMHIRELLGCRVVVSFRGYDLNFSGLEQGNYYDEVWEQADVLHLLGEDLWQRALTRGCPADKKHRLIPPAVDLDFWSRDRAGSGGTLGTSERPLRILSVGRLEWKKGYEFGLQTIRRLVDQGIDCRYDICGDGTAFESIAFARYQLNLDQIVRFEGAASPSRIREKMMESDVLLHAAVSEGFCNAVVEAQAMSLPSVVTDADGLSENVSHGETGFVVPRRDPGAMAGRIALLAQDPDLRESMGKSARRRAVEMFSLEKQIGDFVDLYSELQMEPNS